MLKMEFMMLLFLQTYSTHSRFSYQSLTTPIFPVAKAKIYEVIPPLFLLYITSYLSGSPVGFTFTIYQEFNSLSPPSLFRPGPGHRHLSARLLSR